MNSDLVEMVEYSFGSVWALELLLLLHRNPDRAWPTSDLVRELRSSDVVVAESIERLVASGLVVVDGDSVRPNRTCSCASSTRPTGPSLPRSAA
jgi:hypothetical protein